MKISIFITLDTFCKCYMNKNFMQTLKKCGFLTNSVIFLGNVILADGIKVDPSKVEAILNWPNPKNIHDVISF